MNDVINKMKADVSALKNQEQSNGNPETGTISSEENSNPQNSGSDSGGTHSADSPSDTLSDRDRFELDKAIKSGWKPPEQWQGDPEDFIKPREWNRTVALYKRIDRESDQRRRLEQQQQDFQKRIQNVMEVTRAKTIAELEAQKKEAVENSDYATVKDIDEQINRTNEEYATQEEPTTQAQQEIRPEVQEWIDDHDDWFEQDPEMTDFAVNYQTTQLNKLRNPANPTSEELRSALDRTTKAVKRAFPDKFGMTPRATAPELERGQPRASKRNFGYNDLTAEEKTFWANFERFKNKDGKPAMSQEDYIQAIADMKAAGR